MITEARKQELMRRAAAVGYVPPPRKYDSLMDKPNATEPLDYGRLLLAPEASAFLVVDVQNIFFGPDGEIPARGGNQIIDPINRLSECCRELGMPVIWTMWCHRPGGTNVGGVNEYWRGIAPLLPDDDRASLHESLKREQSDIVIQKPKYSAFHGSDLQDVLLTFGIESLILAGIATDVCVGQTLVDAYHRDYNCAILEDGTATETPFQRETLWHHEEYLARVLTSSEAALELKAMSK